MGARGQGAERPADTAAAWAEAAGRRAGAGRCERRISGSRWAAGQVLAAVVPNVGPERRPHTERKVTGRWQMC